MIGGLVVLQVQGCSQGRHRHVADLVDLPRRAGKLVALELHQSFQGPRVVLEAAPRAPFLDGLVDALEKMPDGEGLRNEIDGPVADGLDGRLDVVAARHDHDQGRVFVGALREGEPRAVGQVHVDEHDVVAGPAHEGAGVGHGAGNVAPEAADLQHRRHERLDLPFVIQDQYLRRMRRGCDIQFRRLGRGFVHARHRHVHFPPLCVMRMFPQSLAARGDRQVDLDAHFLLQRHVRDEG